ncbi:MAG: aldehyde dehydrogenase family protein [Mycobacteriales bacterium]
MLHHFYGGRRQAPLSDVTNDIVDPSTGEVYDTAPVAGPADLDEAFAAAAQGFSVWRATPPAQRMLALLRLAQDLEDHAEQFVDAECRNTGKPREAMRAEIPHVLDVIRSAAGQSRAPEGLASGEYVEGHTSVLRREPIGVIAQITPWNYPLMMATWKWAPAVAAGNAVVLKSAETTPVTPLMLAELAAEHLPPGVLNVVCGDRSTGQAMVRHVAPAMVAITGSVRAGREVVQTSGLKRLHLELGGKAPVVVLDDCDLDLTVAGILDIGYYNAGQSCTAATKVLATPRVHDELVARLAAGAQAMRTGGPDEDGYYGALNNPDQLARVAGLVDRRGAHTEVVAGGAALDRPGFFYPPTVVAGVLRDDELAREEVFGPVVTVTRVADEEDALAVANSTDYGLAASVWTTSSAAAHRAARALDFGAVWINCHSVLATEMPHGGYASSGWGSDLSPYSLRDYTRLKHVVTRWDL